MAAETESMNVIDFSDDMSTNWLWSDFWPVKLLWNLLAYCTFFIPVFLFVFIVKRCHYCEQDINRSGLKSLFYKFVKFFVIGNERHVILPQQSVKDGILLKDGRFASSANNVVNETLQSKLGAKWLLTFCTLGLLATYVVWGYLQEKIMTTAYWVPLADGSGGKKLQKFKDSQFLVFANRIVALLIATVYVVSVENRGAGGRHPAMTSSSMSTAVPFYKYFFASFSNIMSSWCQYEALKFISFPTQVLGKASKIVPVMLMGRIVERRSYPAHQYFTGFLISLGVCVFLLLGDETSSSKRYLQHTTWSGAVLMLGYLIFDSFTSNWQAALFAQYHVTSMQMMCGVNFFSAFLTLLALVEQNQLKDSLVFIYASSEALRDVICTSLFSAVGQLFIFYTIAQFGAVTFTIIMTVRQALSILLSCLLFGHQFRPEGTIGIVIVFFGLFLRQYFDSRFSSKPN